MLLLLKYAAYLSPIVICGNLFINKLKCQVNVRQKSFLSQAGLLKKAYYKNMLERVRLSPKTAQFPRGIMERSTNRYRHPETGMIVYAEPGHITRRGTKLVPIFDASNQEKK
jgi:hypothetical protein